MFDVLATLSLDPKNTPTLSQLPDPAKRIISECSSYVRGDKGVGCYDDMTCSILKIIFKTIKYIVVYHQ